MDVELICFGTLLFARVMCRQMSPEYLVLGESYVSAKQVKVDTRDGLDIIFAVVDFDVNQQVFGIVRLSPFV